MKIQVIFVSDKIIGTANTTVLLPVLIKKGNRVVKVISRTLIGTQVLNHTRDYDLLKVLSYL